MKFKFEEQMQTIVESISQLIARTLGEKCEVLICRIMNDNIPKIIYSENASSEHSVGFIYNELDVDNLLNDDKNIVEKLIIKGSEYVKSTTVLICNTDEVIATITVNLDITNLIFVQNQLQGITSYLPKNTENQISDVDELVDHMLMQALNAIGKPTTHMKKEEKKEFIRYLDERGYFQIKKSTEKVAKYLDISKFTLYTCLEDIRSADYVDKDDENDLP